MIEYVPSFKNLLFRGYKRLGNSKCRECKQPIQWWQTPKGKKITLNPPPDDPKWESAKVQMHRDVCKGRDQNMPLPGPVDLDQEAERIARKLGLRLVILCDDTGEHFSYRRGQNPEDLRHDCITVGNRIRQQMGANDGN